ncbi:hypothetical protein HPB48_002902 [Haemaphysalis longicornis]|uniref:Uncharacterized protein n=1 Tax=Haemaphysalis longicornis TaxID=44386 RepID=A0A9J6FFC1_HAELO|nr:hypothetical protein HPB48_002902 [Haemaphysalis longicornis]
MGHVEVAGEEISPEECTAEAGWRVHTGAHQASPNGDEHGQSRRRRPGNSLQPRPRERKPLQLPALPREDIKIILRAREGLDVTKASSAGLRDGIFRVIGVAEQEAEGYLQQANAEKNLIVTSARSMEPAK